MENFVNMDPRGARKASRFVHGASSSTNELQSAAMPLCASSTNLIAAPQLGPDWLILSEKLPINEEGLELQS